MTDLSTPLTQALSVQFAGPSRAWLKDLYALDATLGQIGRQGLAHEVAHVKLDWWREEITRLQQGEPRHPCTQALHAHRPKNPLYLRFDERLTAVEFELVGFAPTALAELLTWVDRSHGALQRLIAVSLGGADPVTLSRAGLSLGRGLGLRDWLIRAEVSEELSRDGLLDLATQSLDDAIGALPPSAHRAQRHGLVQATLARAQLHAARDPSRGAPGALSQYWRAFKTARAAQSTGA